MSAEPAEILTAALSLPDDQRAGLAYKLLQSLKPPGLAGEDDPGLEAELERRVAAYDRGETTASDWQDVSERIRGALEKRKSP
jgi:putative addiction module component (TIGR02574 family)